jgi:hypothetical protein
MTSITRRETLPMNRPSVARRSPAGNGTRFVAVVHAADGIRFAAVADSRLEVVRRLAEYTRRRAAHTLRPEHARHLRALLARGELEGAVEVYFGLVGQRWDKEWLVTTAVTTEDGASVAAAVGAVAPPADDVAHVRSKEAG